MKSGVAKENNENYLTDEEQHKIIIKDYDMLFEYGQVNMVATQEEIEYWKGYVEKHIDDQKAVLTGINQKYDMCCNDSYNTINMYYDQELSFKKAFSCVGKTAIYCAMYQILDGNPDYSIYLNIYNVDTGKLVVGGNLMNEEVSYTDEDWEKTF